jgi:hypothetical protein
MQLTFWRLQKRCKQKNGNSLIFTFFVAAALVELAIFVLYLTLGLWPSLRSDASGGLQILE